MRQKLVLAAATALLVAACGADGDQPAGEPVAKRFKLGAGVVASGLDAPRHVSFGPLGSLYVAEAGKGGSGPCIIFQGTPLCYGLTGAVTNVSIFGQKRVVTGLASLAAAGGFQALSGPGKISVTWSGIHIAMGGLAGDSSPIAGQPGVENLSHILKVRPGYPSWTTSRLADMLAFEQANNPDGTDVFSNPVDVIRDGSSLYVADAAGNTLLKVDKASGAVSLVAVLPPQFVQNPFAPPGVLMPCQSVPVAVKRGPDGALYVAELTGFPFPVGKARIFRVVEGQAPTVHASGFTTLADVDWDHDGNLLVLEYRKNGVLGPDFGGRLTQVNSDGTRTVISEDLHTPIGIAIGPLSGDIYVSNCNECGAGQGEVLRIPH